MKHSDELPPACGALGGAIVVVSVFDFVRFAARLASIFINWHSAMVTLPVEIDRPHAVGARDRVSAALRQSPYRPRDTATPHRPQEAPAGARAIRAFRAARAAAGT